jgi:hypothetical protein
MNNDYIKFAAAEMKKYRLDDYTSDGLERALKHIARQAMNEVFAFEWCGCIYESGYSVVSLHTTKRDALKAMIAEANRKWQANRDAQLMYGIGRRGEFDMLAFEAWRVRPMKVHSECRPLWHSPRLLEG